MQYLRHSWFDPTSLMSRDVQWDVLSTNHSDNTALVEEYRSAFLSEYDVLKTTQPKRRGRQRQSDSIQMRQYPEQLAKAIGAFGNEHCIHALYAVKMAGRPVALVALRVEKGTDITTHLDAVYVIDKWRRRGLGQAIAENAGRWATMGMNAWNQSTEPLPLVCTITTRNPLEAALASAFMQGAQETAHLHCVQAPELRWLIETPPQQARLVFEDREAQLRQSDTTNDEGLNEVTEFSTESEW